MSSPIISVEHLSKKYRITHQGQRQQYETLRDVLAAKSKHMLARLKPGKTGDSNGLSTRSTKEDFWALKDVSFQVQPGEVLGIIGRNGAGKSTLLKILSRITDPTEGRVTIRGRVASLLEVGTGFHQELTGRENVFLNGAILGMSHAEIKRKFDEIVEFSGVEQFLDTPVKRYSSGMYVRLAFAVAAHLEPEILIVDEVLAVGDTEFQKKCLGKMKDISGQDGRTVLFVSHNISAVQTLCTRGILLGSGKLLLDGTADSVAEEYQKLATGYSLILGRSVPLDNLKRWGGNGKARFTSVRLYDPNNPDCGEQSVRQGDLGFALSVQGDLSIAKAAAVQISDQSDRKIVNCNTLQLGAELSLTSEDSFHIIVRNLTLRPGIYKVGLWLGTGDGAHIDVIADNLSMEVLPPLGRKWHSQHDGVYECPFEYRIVPQSAKKDEAMLNPLCK
jgi:lipopolysaccharide transport system ATP-binding protein